MSKLNDITINEWKKVKLSIDSLLETLKTGIFKEPTLIFLDNADFKKMFKITDKTAQRWRDNNIVGYSKISGNIYYTLKDIQDLYQNYYVEPRNKVNNQINKRKYE